MQRITEFKTGKKSIFKVETVIDGAVVDSKIINVQIDTVTVKNKEYNLLYNSSYELIEDAYNFLNHNQKRLSANSIKAEMYALRYLYVFREIIDKPIAEFTRIDFLKLNYFLSGVSADGSEVEYNLLTKRNSETINSFFSVYRELYRYLDLTSAPKSVNDGAYSAAFNCVVTHRHMIPLKVLPEESGFYPVFKWLLV